MSTQDMRELIQALRKIYHEAHQFPSHREGASVVRSFVSVLHNAELKDRVEEKKQKLEGDKAVRIASVRNGAMDNKPQTSRKVGLFEGGPSFWDNDDDDMAVSTQGSVAAPKRTTKKPFDSDALAEFNDVADPISKAVVKSRRVTTDGSLEPTSVARMSAAVVYAKGPQQSLVLFHV